MSAVRNDERYKLFLELMPKNKYNVSKSALEAGFSASVARTQQKRIMAQAIKYQLERAGVSVSKVDEKPVVEAKKTMAEIVGFSREEIMNNIKYLATQEKDMSVRLRVVSPLAKEFGVDLAPDDNKAGAMPMLNITVTPKDGLTQPSNERRKMDIVGNVVEVESEEVGGGEQPERGEEILSPMPPL